MSRLIRTICIVLCAVAGANSSDPKSRSQFLRDRNRNAFDFYNFGNDPVREITLLIEITSPNPNMEIKLETNEELAESIERVTLPIWFKGQFGVRDGGFQTGSYRYQRKGGRDTEIDSRDIVRYFAAPIDIGRILSIGKSFELKIFVQPSHVLFVVPNSSLSLTVFYGDSTKKDSETIPQGIDAIFDSIHVEGDLKVLECKVRTGGSFIKPAAIPSHVKTFPYTNDIALDMVKLPSSNRFEQMFESRGIANSHYKFMPEWEVVIRGKMGDKNTRIRLLGDDAIMLTIDIFYTKREIQIGPNKPKMEMYNDKRMNDYALIYTYIPFHPNADFDLSIHRMAGKKFGKMQVTVRCNTRIVSYYVNMENKKIISNSIKLKIEPTKSGDVTDVEVYQAVNYM